MSTCLFFPRRDPSPVLILVLSPLPLASRARSDIYYRDNIGNVSTSTVRHTVSGVELSLLSRFPMYGGWKNAWYQGYNLPTEVFTRWGGERPHAAPRPVFVPVVCWVVCVGRVPLARVRCAAVMALMGSQSLMN